MSKPGTPSAPTENACLSSAAPAGLGALAITVRPPPGGEVLATYNVKRRRVYPTGLNTGGHGPCDLAMRYPNYCQYEPRLASCEVRDSQDLSSSSYSARY